MERRRQAERPRHRGSPQILWRLIGAAAGLAFSGQAALGTSPAVAVYARYDLRVAHVETVGTMFNDTKEVGGGSGLLIGDDLVLTNNHVIPKENNYKTLEIFVRPKSRAHSPMIVEAVYRDTALD